MRPISKPTRWAIVGTALSCLTACKQPGTSTGNGQDGPVATQSMYLHMMVREESGTRVDLFVALNSDSRPLDRRLSSPFGNTFVLDGGDELRACHLSVCEKLSPSRDYFTGSIGNYGTNFDYSPDTQYVVSFSRPSATSALNSSVTIPPAFTITEPATMQQFGDGQTIHLSWWPIGSENNVPIDKYVSCMLADRQTMSNESTSVDLDRNGYEDFAVNDLIAFTRTTTPTTPANPVVACDINFTVTHERSGTVDPNFRGGEAVGVVTRGITIKYMPPN